MTPPRPYLVRALIDWIVDNDCTPFVAIASDMDGVTVPPATAKDGRVVLNLSASATRNLEISNERLTVDCRFGGKPFHVTAPMGAVVAVFARESGEGMSFEPEAAGQDAKRRRHTAPTKPPPKQGPQAHPRDLTVARQGA